MPIKLARRNTKRSRQTHRKQLSAEQLERRDLLAVVVWSSGPNLPAPRSDAAALLAPDDAVLVFGGTGNATSVPKLADGAPNWSSAHELENARVGPGAARTGGNGILVYGGIDGNEGSDEVLDYDYSFGDSQDADKLAIGRSDFGYATDEMFRAYAIGGLEKEGDQILTSVERYDATADSWTSVASLPSARRGAAAVADHAGSIYVFGGTATTQGSVVENTTFRYTISSNTWDTVASMPVGTRDSAIVEADDGVIYVLGGRSAGGTLATVQAYDPATDSWTMNTDLPVAAHSQAATIDATGHIVVMGGTNAAGNSMASVYRSQRLDIPDSTPTFITSPVTVGSLDTPYHYDVHASANPAATYSLIVSPVGMTIDTATGSISWQPEVGQHGQQAVTIRAENQVGSTDQSFVVNTAVNAPIFTSNPNTSASLDGFYSYTATADGSPAATFSVVAGPAGMTVDAQSGVVSWQPVLGQEGQQAVTLHAENFVGSNEQSFVIDVAFDTIAPTAPTGLTVDGVGTTTIDLRWQPATDNRGIDYYEVLKGYRSGWRGRNTSYRVIKTGIPSTSTTLTDLPELSSHKLVVRAVDLGGNSSLRSTQVVATTQAAPVIRYYRNGRINPQVGVKANHPLTIQLAATANPTPTYAILSGPTGITLDPATGLLQWTPTAADVGAHVVTVEGTNSVGSAQLEIPIDVAADLPVLGASFTPNSSGYGSALAGIPMEIQVTDASHTTSTFELLDGPANMTLDAATGLIGWLPTTAEAGQTSVTVRGTNSAGSTIYTFTFETFFTTEPTNIQVSGEALLVPTVTWDAPTSDGAVNVAGYTVTAYVRYRWGSRSWRTHRVTTDVSGGATTTEMEGLLVGKQYSVWINAYDAEGNRGMRSTETVRIRSIPAVPNIRWTVTNPIGTATVANQPVEIQLTNNGPDPATFEVIDAPVGLTIDANTGLATWTPGLDNIGRQVVKFRATNSVGPRDITVSLNILFSGMVSNPIATKSGNVATVSWTAPTDNVVPIVAYKITMHWNWSSRRRSRSFTVAGSSTSTTFGLVPTGSVWHKGVTITPIDSLGRLGKATSLVWYAG